MDSSNLDLRPHMERVGESYAEDRIQEKIAMYERDRPQVGLRNVDETLKSVGVPPALRLHYITAVAHLGRISQKSLDARTRNARMGEDRGTALE